MFASIFPRIYLFGNTLWHLIPERATSALAKIVFAIHVIAIEGLATFYHVIPASLEWFYHRNISQKISYYSLQVTAKKETTHAYLYLHGKLNVKDQEVTPVLLLHGDYGHPFTLLHLAKIAENESKGPVFSLYIPRTHDNSLLDDQSLLLKQAIDKIEQLIVKQGGRLKGILGAGHSKGCILLADRQFVHQEKQLKGVFAVGGRLNVPPQDKSCPELLKPFVKNIFRAIKMENDKPLIQIIPQDDWNSSREAMAVRPAHHCHIVPGMHLSGLYAEETSQAFVDYLNSR